MSDQPRLALMRANEVRVARAELKRRIANGSLSVGALLGDPPDVLLGARVIDALRSMPKVGPVKARTVLASEGMSVTVRFGDLSPARRAALIATLESCQRRSFHEAAHKPITPRPGTKR